MMLLQFRLADALKRLRFAANADSHSFFPRCYDLQQTDDRSAFLQDFAGTHAEAVLKCVLAAVQVGLSRLSCVCVCVCVCLMPWWLTLV